ncbi:MAG: hypothetical protein WDZ52_10295 [Pseudohongiellaceae bacterium]
MANDSKKLSPNFEAVLSIQSLEEGELKHAEIEMIRKISMRCGLTKSSTDLDLIFQANPKLYLEAFEYGIRALRERFITLRKRNFTDLFNPCPPAILNGQTTSNWLNSKTESAE